MIIVPFLVVLLVGFFYVAMLILRLRRAGIVGKDLHKLCRNTPVMYDSTGLGITPGRPSGMENSKETMQGLLRAVTSDHSTPRGKPVHPEALETDGRFWELVGEKVPL